MVADRLIEVATDKWLTIGELARIGFIANTIATKRRTRAYLSRLFMVLRSRGLFLAIEYLDENGAASRVKIADLNSKEEREIVLSKLERMKRRKELSQEQYEKSIALLHAKLC